MINTDCGMDGEIMKKISGCFSTLKHLKIMSIQGNRIGDDGCTAVFSNCKDLPNLEILNLISNCKV